MSERPTPYSIAICALIALHSDPSSPLHDLGLNRNEQEELTKFLEESACTTTTTNKPNADLSTLLQHVRQRLGHGIAALLEDTLEMAAESIDSLIDLMDSLRVAVTEGLVDAVSSHGVFLRMVCLGFEQLSFESGALLWEDLKNKLYQVEEMLEDDNSEVNDSNGSKVTTTSWPLSTSQMESILRQDCIDLQHGRMTTSPSAADDNGKEDLSFESIELKIRSMIEKDPELPAAYFLRFLNCLNHGERVGAIDALHQYFDQATVQHTSPKDILRFSAILLAVAHSAFGDTDLSLMATEEAVRVAQQTGTKDKDAACVAFALGWLFENNGHGTAERRELLKRCATRALQGQLRPLVAGANLALAKHYLGEDRRGPSDAWTSLMEVSSEQAADNLSNLDRPTYMTEVPKEAMESIAQQSLVSAGIWDAFNFPALSGLQSMVALNYQEHLSAQDILTAVQNVSMLSLHGTSIAFLRDNNNKTIRQTEKKGKKTGCVYANAISTLIRLQENFGLDKNGLPGPFLHTVMLILHEWAVNRGDLEDAKALGVALDSYLHTGLSNYDQLSVDFGMQKCLRLCREQCWEKARGVAEQFLDTCKTKGLKNQHGRILIQLSIIELESNTKQIMAALSPLLEALSFCEKFDMYGMHAVALSVLAKIFLRLQNPQRALAILRAAIPTLLQREHIWYQAEAFLTLSKCHIQLAGTTKSRTRSHRLRAAEIELKKSQSLFEECQDLFRLREVLYLQARLYSQLENLDARESSSQEFVTISNYLNKTDFASSSILDKLSDPSQIQGLLDRTVLVGA